MYPNNLLNIFLAMATSCIATPGKGGSYNKAENIGNTDFSTGALRLQGARILLAENNLFNQQVAKAFLEKAGATVSIAQNGKEAIDLLLKERFDCVLMDIQMPVMDGYEATQLIRTTPALAEIPVIAMTANSTQEDRERCLDAGMDDFISKPFQPFLLSYTIAKWLALPLQQLSFPDKPCPLHVASDSEEDAGLIEMNVLAQLVDGNEIRMRSFAQKFLAHARADILEIDIALCCRDIAALAVLGHHNIGPASIVGAKGYAKLCKSLAKLEENAGGVDEARNIVNRMHTLLDRISVQIDGML